MRTQTIIIKAGEAFDLAAAGDYVRVRYSAVELTIEQPDSGEKIEVSQGDDFQFTEFSRLRVSHASGSDQTVKLTISKGKKAGSSQVSGSITVAGQNGAFTNDRASAVAAYAINIRNANAARRYLMIQNLDTGANMRVRVDGGAASASMGIRLKPGESIEYQGYVPTGAISVMMETTESGTYNCHFVEG